MDKKQKKVAKVMKEFKKKKLSIGKIEKKQRHIEAQEKNASSEMIRSSPRLALTKLSSWRVFLSWLLTWQQIEGEIKSDLIMKLNY